MKSCEDLPDSLNSSSASVSDVKYGQTKPGKLQPHDPAGAHQSSEVQGDGSACHPRASRPPRGAVRAALPTVGVGGVSWSVNEPQRPTGAGMAVASPGSGRHGELPLSFHRALTTALKTV